MTLHPDSRAFLEMIEAAAAPAWYEMPVDEARRTFNELPLFGETVALPAVEDKLYAGVPVREYRADSREGGVIAYFHGGGWVLGDLESHDALCRRLAQGSGATVVSVDYRKPPESPFPAALEDCYAVCQQISQQIGRSDHHRRLIVAGDSAGGNLAIATALKARQQQSSGESPKLAGQVLIYPVLDAAMSSASYRSLADGFGLTRQTMAWFWEQYTGPAGAAARQDPLASPLAAEDFADLPPTHVLTAEYDVLRDEGRELVRRLQAAGVPVSHHDQVGMLHGFVHFAAAFQDAAAVTQALAQTCRQMLEPH